ncbi:RNA-guided endonuclease TnpB family protein, partial [uncultured Thiodictyon sp.]|uniref:RNA-guided endonuclease InsQ/TnpB family protein n=1 Tax=uncultured Thiodictyon sp. TaxID=1846217 RepID=UPI0025EDED71
RQLNAIKREQFPWMLEVTKCAPQQAIMQLGEAFKNFFAGRAKYPRFHKKGRNDSFALDNGHFVLDGSRIRLPHLGWVRIRETLRFTGKIVSATISRTADRWFVAVVVDTDQILTRSAENQGVVGVDLGVTRLATLSNGEQVSGPKAHKAELKRMERLNRSLSRKVKFSRNWRKTKAKLARLHARIANVRLNAMHTLTSDLARRFHTIGIEDLNVRGMVQNRHLARAVSDMSFFEFRRQLEYKSALRGGRVVVADRWYPSSKTCSGCAHQIDSLPLAVRQWDCPACGSSHDRDLNAAINLAHYAASSAVSACGGEGAGAGRKVRTKPAPVKQEVNFVHVCA